MQNVSVPNENFEPTEGCERVLDVFKAGRESGDPWGRANPRYVIDKTGIEKANVEYHLRRLKDAGWITKVSRGLYEFVDDPREGNDE